MKRWSMRVSMIFTLLFVASLAAASPRDLIEGSYELTEWTDGGVTLTPPAVSGRYVIRDGLVTWVVHKASDGRELTNAYLGSYQLTSTTFSYGYGNRFSFSTDGQSFRVDRQSPPGFEDMALPRMREFTLKEEGGVLKASYKSARFEFSRDGVIYIDDISKAVRKYRRINGE